MLANCRQCLNVIRLLVKVSSCKIVTSFSNVSGGSREHRSTKILIQNWAEIDYLLVNVYATSPPPLSGYFSRKERFMGGGTGRYICSR